MAKSTKAFAEEKSAVIQNRVNAEIEDQEKAAEERRAHNAVLKARRLEKAAADKAEAARAAKAKAKAKTKTKTKART